MGDGNKPTGLVVFNKLVNLANKLTDAYETTKRLDAEMKKLDSETRVSLAEINKEKLKIDKAYRICREGIKSLSNSYIKTLNKISSDGEEYRKCLASYREHISKAFEIMITTQDADMRQLMKDSIHGFQEGIKELADRLKDNNNQIITNAAQHIQKLPCSKSDTRLITDK